MAKRVWRIEGCRVYRGRTIVARIYKLKSGEFAWRGFFMRREGFKAADEHLLADVKYMHRYQRNKPLVTFRYRSGRIVEVW